MRIENGEVLFCNGCPAQGTFVGPLTEETKMQVGILFPGEGKPAPITWDRNKDVIASLVLRDSDVGASQSITAHTDTAEFRKRGPSSMLTRSSNSVERIEKAANATVKPLVERVGRCIAGQSFAVDYCPATHTSAYSRLFTESLVKVRPSRRKSQ